MYQKSFLKSGLYVCGFIFMHLCVLIRLKKRPKTILLHVHNNIV